MIGLTIAGPVFVVSGFSLAFTDVDWIIGVWLRESTTHELLNPVSSMGFFYRRLGRMKKPLFFILSGFGLLEIGLLLVWYAARFTT